MADPKQPLSAIDKINQVVADPDFLKLPEDQQKLVLLHIKGGDTSNNMSQGLAPLPGHPNDLTTSNIVNAGRNVSNPTSQFLKDPNTRDTAIDLVRPFAAGAAGTAAGTATAGSGLFTGGLSSVATPAAAASSYALVDGLLQHLKSQQGRGTLSTAANLKEGSIPSTLANSAEQWGIGKVTEGVLRVGKGIVSAFSNNTTPEIADYGLTTSQALKQQGHSILAWIAKSLEDLNVSSKSAALNKAAGKGFDQAYQVAKNADLIFTRHPDYMLELVNKEMPSIEESAFNKASKTAFVNLSESPEVNELAYSFNKIDNVIKDDKVLQKTLSAGQAEGINENLKKTLGGYQFMKIMQDATDYEANVGGKGLTPTRIDPGKINAVWTDPKMQASYDTLYSKQTRASMTEFFNNLANSQDAMNPTKFSKFYAWHTGFGLAASFMSGNPAVLLGQQGGTLGLYLGAQQIGKLLTKPSTAQFMVNLAGGKALGASDSFVGKLLLRGLQGEIVHLIQSDGSMKPTMVRDGKLLEMPQEK